MKTDAQTKDYSSTENMRCHNVGAGGVNSIGMTFFPSHKNKDRRKKRVFQMACRVHNAIGEREQLASLKRVIKVLA